MRSRTVVIVVMVVVASVAIGLALRGIGTSAAGKQQISAGSSAGSSAAPRQSASPAPRPSGVDPAWRSVFQSDFVGSQLDTSVWGTCYPWMESGAGCTNFGNTEYEWYLPSQDRVSGGVLQLAAQRVATQGQDKQGAAKEYSCRSGMVTTYPSFSFEYGYVQIVARIPGGTGLWPALWLLPSNQSWPPEIDMLEHWGASSTPPRLSLFPTGHAHEFSYSTNPATADLSVGWHTFGLSWTAGKLTWFIDGKKVMSLSKDIPHQRMYLIANLAESVPTQSDSGCSGTMLVRSVGVWQP